MFETRFSGLGLTEKDISLNSVSCNDLKHRIIKAMSISGVHFRFGEQEFNDEEITKAICVFTFSVDQLRTFTEYVTNIVLENIDYGICSNCPYQEENENGNPDL